METTIVSLLFVVFGIGFAFLGYRNIVTGTATESGKRRRTNRALGADSSYTGGKAKLMGSVRIVGGICVAVFGAIRLLI